MQEVSQSLPKAQKSPDTCGCSPQSLLLNRATGQVGTLQSRQQGLQAPTSFEAQ